MRNHFGQSIRRVLWAFVATLVVLPVARGAEDGFIELFNGKDLSQWKVKGGEGGYWTVGTAAPDPDNPREFQVAPEGNQLINARRSGKDIYSEREFGDAIIELEVMVPQGSNSGIYIMGEYEVQVLDSYGREKLTQGDMGAIYSAAEPRVNSAKAPGEWQQYHIRYRAPRFDAQGHKTANAVVGRATTSEAIRPSQEIPLVNGFQNHRDRTLQHLVLEGRNSDRAGLGLRAAFSHMHIRV